MRKDNRVALVVDDEEIDSTLVRRTLERLGNLLVLEARTFDEGLRTFNERSAEIDILVVDVSLPGKNGVDLAKALLRQRRDLKVLFMSGWVGAELIRAHIPESDRHFLSKPFRPADLVARVKAILEESEGPRWLRDDAGAASSESTGN
jgi:DNA-binding response OmpR family regulator